MKRRIDWIDVVKATSVLLVVFMHASNTLIDIGGRTAVTGVLATFNHLVEPMRMPVFFLVSGMLAASAIRRPWADSTRRTAGMLYLYVLWMLLYAGFVTAFGAHVNDPFSAILFARSGFWYLYAMALFFIIARLLRTVSLWLVLPGALALNALRPVVDELLNAAIPGTLFTSMTLNLVFFLVGVHFKDVVGAVAQRIRPAHTVALGLISLAAGITWRAADITAGQSYLPLSVLWMGFGIGLAGLVARHGAPAWARYLGARTLPIYVLQWPVLFLAGSFLPGAAVANPVAQVLFPFAVCAVVTAAAVYMHREERLSWLFSAPMWVTRPQPLAAELRERLRAAEPVTVTNGR